MGARSDAADNSNVNPINGPIAQSAKIASVQRGMAKEDQKSASKILSPQLSGAIKAAQAVKDHNKRYPKPYDSTKADPHKEKFYQARKDFINWEDTHSRLEKQSKQAKDAYAASKKRLG